MFNIFKKRKADVLVDMKEYNPEDQLIVHVGNGKVEPSQADLEAVGDLIKDFKNKAANYIVIPYYVKITIIKSSIQTLK